MNSAIIVAGGSGKRFGSETPKQFLKIGGKEILKYSSSYEENYEKLKYTGFIISEGDSFDNILFIAWRMV